MAERLFVNGVDLSTLARRVETLGGILSAPERRGEDLSLPHRHGKKRRPGKKYEPAGFSLRIWVLGCTHTGGVPVGSTARAEFHARLDELAGLFHTDAVDLVSELDNGTRRQAVAEVDGVMDLSRQHGEPRGQLAVALTIPDSFWSDVDEIVSSSGPRGSGTTSWTLTEYQGANAPMPGLRLRFTAGGSGANNPRLTQGDRFFQYGASMTAGQWVECDFSTWQITTGGGLAKDEEAISYGVASGGPFFELAHNRGAAPEVQLSHTGSGTLDAELSGRRNYLIG